MPDSYRKFLGFGLNSLILLTAALQGCSNLQIKAPDVPEIRNQPAIQIESVDLLHVSPEMRAFARRFARDDTGPGGKAFSLAYAAHDPYLLEFDYDPRITLPADQAFQAGTGNCLTFSSLFIAMAREAGLDAWYQEVKIPPVWSAVNETMLFSMHVNAVVRDGGTKFTVDVSGRKSSAVEQVRRLTDREAKAQYYNNLGADALIEENLALAYAYFRKAIETDSTLPYIWSNLGVVLRRNDQTNDAKLAYQTALRLEPRQSVALNNLYTIYSEDGDLKAAKIIEAKVERNRRNNPYYLNYLAEIANEERRYSDAISLANKAIKIESNEYRFYYTLAQSQYFSGKKELAQISLEEAIRLAPPDLEQESLSLPGENTLSH